MRVLTRALSFRANYRCYYERSDMRKIYIRTSDIFDYKDAEKRMKHFDFCRKKALECGLICRSHIDGMNTRLFIEGRKSKMVRYYLATIFKTGDGANGVKRLISIIFTH